MGGYGQFCPVAKAAEIVAERWTPLVLRELLSGSHRFNDIRRGVPLMSRSLLSKRLSTLVRAGLVERRKVAGRDTKEYFLTPAGEELRPIIDGLGAWGQRWVTHELAEEDLDPSLLMWDMRRMVKTDDLGEQRIVLRFDFTDTQGPRRRWWLLADHDDAEICLTDPGFEVDLHVTTTLRAFTRYWLGQRSWREMLASEELTLDGPAWLVRSLPGWLGQSSLADVPMPGAAERS